MTQDELDTLPDVTPSYGAASLGSRTPQDGGLTVVIPVLQHGHHGALFTGPDDGEFTCSRTGQRYMVGRLDGLRVKRKME